MPSKQYVMNLAMSKAIQAGTRANIWLYRRTNGRVGGRGIGRLPLLLPTVPGRSSGMPRTVPVAYLDHNGGYLIWTGMGGSKVTPQWFLNLQPAGKGHIQIGRREHDVDAPHQRGRTRQVVAADHGARTALRQMAGANRTQTPGRCPDRPLLLGLSGVIPWHSQHARMTGRDRRLRAVRRARCDPGRRRES
jgi:deazaflavin-dependent oxidoreductase (nitroreductase family)